VEDSLNRICLICGCLIALVLIACTKANANEIEKNIIGAGLVDIQAIDPSIRVDLVNSHPDKNFFRENYYQGLTKAYIRPEVAPKLANAQKFLQMEFPQYSLLIMDAARPRGVSQKMHEKMKGTPFEKYVAKPDTGSMHNFGIAVDVTIVDGNNNEIDMGFTPFYKNTLSIYWGFAKLKVFGFTEVQKQNRELLARIMKKAGFFPLSYEWWHFEGIPKNEARKKYRIIE